MLQSLLNSNIFKLFSCLSEEGAARCGKYQLFNKTSLTAFKALEYSRMLTVNRIYLYTILFCRRSNDTAACNESFLVCKSNILSCLYCRECRKKSCNTDYSVHNSVRFFVLSSRLYTCLTLIHAYIRI